MRTARDIYSQIFQQDDSSGGDDETNFNPGELHQHLGSLDPAAYAEASQASLELLAMGPQLKALDKRFEGELSQVFADILLQHSVSSSFPRSTFRICILSLRQTLRNESSVCGLTWNCFIG